MSRDRTPLHSSLGNKSETLSQKKKSGNPLFLFPALFSSLTGIAVITHINLYFIYILVDCLLPPEYKLCAGRNFRFVSFTAVTPAPNTVMDTE